MSSLQKSILFHSIVILAFTYAFITTQFEKALMATFLALTIYIIRPILGIRNLLPETRVTYIFGIVVWIGLLSILWLNKAY